jgi:SmpA / OmlA family
MWSLMKRYRFLVLLLTMAAPAVSRLLGIPWYGPLFRADLSSLRPGMTEKQVKAILGKPWDDSLFDGEGPSASAQIKIQSQCFSSITLGDLNDKRRIYKYRLFWIDKNSLMFVPFDRDGYSTRFVLISDPDRAPGNLAASVWRRLRKHLPW